MEQGHRLEPQCIEMKPLSVNATVEAIWAAISPTSILPLDGGLTIASEPKEKEKLAKVLHWREPCGLFA